jgi:hypothetical protein
MAKRSKQRQPRATRSDAEVEADLEALDTALAEGDDERAAASLQSLRAVRRRVPDLLARRLIAGRARNPFLLLNLLAAYADRRVAPLMERIVDANGTPDLVRFGAQRHAGWDFDEPQERQEFLATLADPEATLVEAARYAVSDWPPDGDVLDEVHVTLHALSPERRRAVVARIVAELGAEARWLLHALVHEDERELRRLALDELVRLRAADSEAAIARLLTCAPDRGTRRQAEEALRQLRADARPGVPARSLPPLLHVKASPPDAEGAQAVIVARRALGGLVMFAMFLCEEGEVSTALATRHATAEQLTDVESKLTGPGIPLVDIDLAEARGLVASAIGGMPHGTPYISPEFEFWEPFLHDVYPPPADEPYATLQLDDAPYVLRSDLVPRTGALLEHPFFAGWTFDQDVTAAAMAHTRPPVADLWTDEQFRPLIRRLVTSEEREWLRRVLRHQAWFLERTGDEENRDLALATAAALRQAKGDELVSLPFLRAMVRRSADVVASLLALEAELDDLINPRRGLLNPPPFGSARAKPRRR